MIGAVAFGGALGALLRYEASLIWPSSPAGFPATTLRVNLVGCLVIGGFWLVITEVWTAHRLLRPFFGIGVLGGFTTFCTYMDIVNLIRLGHPAEAMLYLLLTAVGALLAVALGMVGACCSPQEVAMNHATTEAPAAALRFTFAVHAGTGHT